jgi:hypothetical protein
VEAHQYGADGLRIKKVVYTYDEAGNIVEQMTFKNVIDIPEMLQEYKVTYRK